jgi:hypothetical protein
MTLPWQFSQLSAWDQRESVRKMSADGLGDHAIAELTGLSVLMIRRFIEQPPRAPFEDWERQKRVDETGGCSNPYDGIVIPDRYK